MRVDKWRRTALRISYLKAQALLFVAPEQLKPVEEVRTSLQEIAYFATAAKVTDTLDENTLPEPPGPDDDAESGRGTTGTRPSVPLLG